MTAFWASFLLFLVQPMAGKALLPTFGGSFMVWAIALTFFQGTLLCGYLAVHFLFQGPVTRLRLGVFAGGFLATAAFFPFPGPESWVIDTERGFLLTELYLLFSRLFLPTLLLSTCSVALQRFWKVLPTSSSGSSGSPYFLYGFSNLGSILGLLAMPFYLEWFFPLARHFTFLATGFRLLTGLILLAIPWNARSDHDLLEDSLPETPHSFREWLTPALAGSTLLLATTNVLTMDVASLPMLWILPLLAYLLSFIRAFHPNTAETTADANLPSWPLRFFPWLLAAGFALAMMNTLGFAIPIPLKIFLLLFLQYALCLACHSELYARRPSQSRNLTRFYLAISLGGWLGSAVLVFLAPLLFRGLSEYPLSLFLVALAIWNEPIWELAASDPYFPIRAVGLGLILFVLPALFNRGMPETGPFLVTAMTGALFYLFIVVRDADQRGVNRVATCLCITASLFALEHFGATSGFLKQALRTYYGMYRIFDHNGIRHLQMGSTFHGHETLAGPEQGKPSMYYHPETPIGHFFTHPGTAWRKIAVLGLGAGTISAFAGEGQTIDFFEIDPAGEMLARAWFSYLPTCRGSVRVITGDGRLQLRKMADQTYDLIIMDAFSSDAIPTHLLTVEAIREYLRALRTDGLLLFHISNRHLFLTPVLKAAALHLGLEIRSAENPEPQSSSALPTRWVAMGNPGGMLRFLAPLPEWSYPASLSFELKPWTDQFANILMVLTWN